MSREKQIECASCLHYNACLINSEYVPSPCRAYENNAGYRKQSEDTVEVVRCKDCAYMQESSITDRIFCTYEKCIEVSQNHFCSWGTPMRW